MNAFIQVRDSAWDAFLALDRETLRTQNPVVENMRSLGQLISGFWNGTVGFVTVNCVGEESELDSFYNYFPPADRLGYWKWGDDGKVDFATEYTGQQDDLLFLHRDIIVYDPSGTPRFLEPATFENPNWGNNWAGTGQNMFARYHARDHGEEFG